MFRNAAILSVLVLSLAATAVQADSYTTTALPTIATTAILDAANWGARAGELYPPDNNPNFYWTSPATGSVHSIPYPGVGGYPTSILVNWNIDWTKVTGAISNATFSFVTDDVVPATYFAPSAVDQMAVYPILQSWDATRPASGTLSVDWANPVVFTGATTVNAAGTNYIMGGASVWQTTVDIGAIAEQWRQNQANVYGILIMPNNYSQAMYDRTNGGIYTMFDYAHVGADAFESLAITYAAAGPILGDCTGDGYVDDNDLGRLLGNWGLDPAVWADGNFNTDTVVDDNDLGALLGAWGNGTPPGAVPEPVTLSLLAIGGLALLRRKASR